METTFCNVTITLTADSPQDAYTRLCNILAKGGRGVEWITDTYYVGNREQDRGSTMELMPNIEA